MLMVTRKFFDLVKKPFHMAKAGLVGLAMTAIHRVRRWGWRHFKSHGAGVQAIVWTDRKTVVLVRHSYMPGWHLPGGGRKRHETPKEAVIRELEEEIGLRSWRTIRHLEDVTETSGRRTHHIGIFALTGVDYLPRASLEIAAVEEFDPARLPASAAVARRRLARWFAQREPGQPMAVGSDEGAKG